MDAGAIRAWFAIQGWPEDVAALARQRMAQWTWRKAKKARRWARMLRFVPGVRMIAIGNALGYGNCHEGSDVDLVIVTAPGCIWIVRLFVVSLLAFFRQRPGERSRDALCPSFFLTTEAMDLEPLQLAPDSPSHGALPPDPYLLFWPTQLTVLYDSGGVYDTFWAANRAWVQHWLPDAEPRAMHPRFSVSPLPSRRGSQRGWSMRVGDFLERWAKSVQEPRLQRVFPQANRDTSVIMSDVMLKFHTNDRRRAFRDAWIACIADSATEQH